MTTAPEFALVYLEEDPGACVSCGHEATKGAVGWSFTHGGPLCELCLSQHDAALGQVLMNYLAVIGLELALATSKAQAP